VEPLEEPISTHQAEARILQQLVSRTHSRRSRCKPATEPS
jgi:hypothetical protein